MTPLELVDTLYLESLPENRCPHLLHENGHGCWCGSGQHCMLADAIEACDYASLQLWCLCGAARWCACVFYKAQDTPVIVEMGHD